MFDKVYVIVMHFWADDEAVRFFYFRSIREVNKFTEYDVYCSRYNNCDIEACYEVLVEDIEVIHFYYE